MRARSRSPQEFRTHLAPLRWLRNRSTSHDSQMLFGTASRRSSTIFTPHVQARSISPLQCSPWLNGCSKLQLVNSEGYITRPAGERYWPCVLHAPGHYTIEPETVEHLTAATRLLRLKVLPWVVRFPPAVLTAAHVPFLAYNATQASLPLLRSHVRVLLVETTTLVLGASAISWRSCWGICASRT